MRCPMLYTVFCYNNEADVASWSPQKDDALMAKLSAVNEKLTAEGKLTLQRAFAVHDQCGDGEARSRADGHRWPVRGNQGAAPRLQIIECETLEEAIEATRRLAGPREGGSLELRPMRSVHQGSGL